MLDDTHRQSLTFRQPFEMITLWKKEEAKLQKKSFQINFDEGKKRFDMQDIFMYQHIFDTVRMVSLVYSTI